MEAEEAISYKQEVVLLSGCKLDTAPTQHTRPLGSASVVVLPPKQTIMYGSVRMFILTSNSQISIPVIYQTHHRMLCVRGKPICRRGLVGGSINKTLFKYRIKNPKLV